MSTKTPRTDEAEYHPIADNFVYVVDADFARQLETELQEAVPASDVKPMVAWMLNHSPACDSDTLKTFLSKHPDLKP